MKYKHNPANVPAAKALRKNMTPEERHLWYDFLKGLPCTVNRQKTIGCFIVDFYIDSAKLVIEIDGSQHYEPEEKAYDEARTAYLNGIGLQVVRFSNHDVDAHFDGVCATIDSIIQNAT